MFVAKRENQANASNLSLIGSLHMVPHMCVLPALASFLHSRLIHRPVAPCRMMSCNSSWNVWTTSEAEMLQNMYWSLLVMKQ